MPTTNESRLCGPQQSVACPGCQFKLPLRAPDANETSGVWECTNCRAPANGALMASQVRMSAQRVRLADEMFQTEELAQSVAAVADIVQQIAKASTKARVGRPAWRLSVPEQLEAAAIGLNTDYSLTGETRRGMVADLSAQGMYLLTTAPIEAPLVVVRMMAEDGPLQLLGRVDLITNLPRKCCGANIEFLARLGRAADI